MSRVLVCKEVLKRKPVATAFRASARVFYVRHLYKPGERVYVRSLVFILPLKPNLNVHFSRKRILIARCALACMQSFYTRRYFHTYTHKKNKESVSIHPGHHHYTSANQFPTLMLAPNLVIAMAWGRCLRNADGVAELRENCFMVSHNGDAVYPTRTATPVLVTPKQTWKRYPHVNSIQIQ